MSHQTTNHSAGQGSDGDELLQSLENMKRKKQKALAAGLETPRRWTHPNTSVPFHRLWPLMDRVDELGKLMGEKPEGWRKPVYGNLDYIIAWRNGWISDEDERRDRIKYEERRDRSLRTCHRPGYKWEEERREPFKNGAYVPEMPAHILHDEDLTDGARRCMMKLLELTYRDNREGRWLATTVTYLMDTLGRCRRTIQNYLRLLERCGYIACEVLLSERTRMCNGLKIDLLEDAFARHHKKAWPPKKEARKPLREHDRPVPDRVIPGVQQDSLSYFNQIYLKERGTPKDRDIPRVSVSYWAFKCMEAIHQRYLINRPPEQQAPAFP